MRWIAVTATAALAEIAGHMLSAGWGMAVLVLAFIVTGMNVASTSTKARSTEARLNAHVVATAPAVNFVANGGTVGGAVTVNGNHTVLGALGVHAGGTVVGAQWTMDNGAVVTGGLSTDTATSSGDMTVGNNIGVHGGTVYYGTGGAALNAAEAAYLSGLSNPGMPTGSSAPPINTSTASQCAGAFYTGSGAANWATNITNVVNGINSALASAGIW